MVTEHWRGDLDRGFLLGIPWLSTGRATSCLFVLFGAGLLVWFSRRRADGGDGLSGTVTHFLPDGAPRLDRFLADSYPEFARSRWDAWVRAGNVRVNGEVVQKAGTRIRAGATVETELPDPAPPAMHLQPEDIDLPTLFEDSHLWIVDKPAGMVVHPGPGIPPGPC